MEIYITPVSRHRELVEFMRVAWRLHRDHAAWVPPLLGDELRTFDPRRNRAHAYCDHALWLARDHRGNVVGRIAGIINRRYNELHGERTARFSHLEFTEDAAVAGALLERVKQWAREAGMDRVIGPMGFTDQDPEGFLVEGFGEPPSIASYQNHEYVVRLLDGLGWTKDVDYVVYKVPVPQALPEVYERVSKRIAAHGTLRLIEFERRRDLKRLIRPILELMDDAFTGLTGYSPLDSREMDDLARRYLPVIDPRFVKVVSSKDILV